MDTTHDRARAALNSVHTAVCIGPRPWSRRLVAGFGALAVSIGMLVPPAQASGLAFSMPSAAWQAAVQGGVLPAAAPENELLERFKATAPKDARKIAPFVELGALDSRQGETKDAFLLRVARILDAFTTGTRHEACGAIMKNASDTAWRVRLISNRSQVACMRIMFEEPGFQATVETIHSHPRPRRFEGIISVRLSRADMLLGAGVCGNHVKLDDEDFSPRDRENGAGYLVARGKLLYRDGLNPTPRLVGTIDAASPMDQLTVGGALGDPTTQEDIHAATVVWNAQQEIPGVPGNACPVFKK